MIRRDYVMRKWLQRRHCECSQGKCSIRDNDQCCVLLNVLQLSIYGAAEVEQIVCVKLCHMKIGFRTSLYIRAEDHG